MFGGRTLWLALGTTATFAVAGIAYVLWPSQENVVANAAEKAAPVNTAAAAPAADAPPSADSPYTRAEQQLADTRPDPHAATPDEPVSVTAAKPVETPPADSTAASASAVVDSNPDATPPTAAAAPQPVTETVAANTETKTPEATPAVVTDAPQKPAAPVLKFDPLDFDPEHLSVASNSANVGAIPPPAAPTNSIPAASTDTPPAAKTADSEKPVAAADLLPPPANEHAAINVKRGPAADEPSVDTAKHFATRVESLKLNDVSLARFVETMSEMAAVPITLDPRTLELNGLSPRTTLSVSAADTTLDTVLRDALTGQRLDFVDAAGLAHVVLANADERKSVDFDVKDLSPTGDAAPVAKLIERFVAPPTWQAGGGKGTIAVDGTVLHIDHSLAARREALIFCERLRLARSLAVRSKYPRELLAIDSPYDKLTPKLGRRTTFTFLPWTRLADVVHEWQALAGVTILVDWQALAEAEFNPSSALTCSSIDRPWLESLDGVLGPLGLAWWPVDSQTLQITSRDALARIERVEFYAVPQKLSSEFPAGDALVAALQKEIAAQPNAPASDIPMQLDEPSGRLIVRANPVIHRFLTGRLSAEQK
jgi:hypothetical protein